MPASQTRTPQLKAATTQRSALGSDLAIMPAVDYLYPGGLSWEELARVLRIALASGKAVGLEVTIYNPDLDGDGHAGCGLFALLAAVLGTAEIGEPGLDPKALETADRR